MKFRRCGAYQWTSMASDANYGGAYLSLRVERSKRGLMPWKMNAPIASCVS
ncbi:MAG: hypothetical protein KGN31_07015 [Betaproteobacteria bacterium]|nr:hypothetical protein [Betaproteobacteria bacterium]